MKTRGSIASGLFLIGTLLVTGCAETGRSSRSELLTLSSTDETITNAAGIETDALRDPLNLLKRGEAYFVQEEYEQAAAAYRRFLEQYPFHRLAAYAQFSIGRCFYHQVGTADRDPTPVARAMAAFHKLRIDYPDSLYVQEAAEKIKELTHLQAEHELAVGHFYYRRKGYTAAAVRFENALEKGGGAVREKALYYLGWTRYEQGDHEKARTMFHALRSEYPHSVYIRKKKLPPSSLDASS
jgi:outer membrane protein assembly factor BamD